MTDHEDSALDDVRTGVSLKSAIAKSRKQRLKSALWFSIGKIVDEETLKMGVNATPHFIGALTEMVWAQIGRISTLQDCS